MKKMTERQAILYLGRTLDRMSKRDIARMIGNTPSEIVDYLSVIYSGDLFARCSECEGIVNINGGSFCEFSYDVYVSSSYNFTCASCA
jgi:hypothetical protein